MNGENNETAITEIRQRGIAMSRPPEAILLEAKKAADALQKVVKGKLKPVIFNGEQYIEFEDWQLLGKFYNITAKVVQTTAVEFGNVRGFEARAVAIDNNTGFEVSAAEAMCLNDEDKWSTRTKYAFENGKKVKVGDVPVPMFQLRSMAQTRACAKCMRNVLAWVVVLAGYKPNVAEEMIGDETDPIPSGPAMPVRKSETNGNREEKAQTQAKPNDRARMRPMASKYSGNCGECGIAISTGTMIFYDGDTKKPYCHPACDYTPE